MFTDLHNEYLFLEKKSNSHFSQGRFLEFKNILKVQAEIENESAIRSGLNPYEVRFIGNELTGPLGHISPGLNLRAKMILAHENVIGKQIIFNSKTDNQFFLKLWEKYFSLNTITEYEKNNIEKIFWFLYERISYVRTKNGVLDLYTAHNLFTKMCHENNANILNFPEDKISAGWKFLSDIDIKTDWFVTLHVRTPANRREGSGRNAEIDTYMPAIKYIIELGGSVIRIGNTSMPKVNLKNNFFDYASYKKKQDWLDIFFLSQNKFMIGTGSGPVNIPNIFGKNILLTNCTSIANMPFYVNSLSIPKLIMDRSGYFSLSKILENGLGWTDKDFKSFPKIQSIKWRNNSADEILNGVKEIINSATMNFNSDDTTIKKRIENAGGMFETKISTYFMNKWSVLLGN